MAGLSFLYAFFNLYSTGGGQGVPTVEEAMMDIESCMAVLEYLTRKLLSHVNDQYKLTPTARVPSAGACHDTMQAVSSAILDQIQKLDPPPRDASAPSQTPDGRAAILRGAPISSSRNDPLPHESSFPTPLPNIPLPYELTLLDNLFVNPMVKHNKASDYTCGSQKRCQQKQAQNGGGQPQPKQTVAGPVYNNPTQFNSFVASTGSAPQSLPPGAFQTGSSFPTNLNQIPQTSNGNGMSLGAYGMAAVGGSSQLDPNNLFTMQNPGGASYNASLNGLTGNANNNNTANGEDGAPFDVFSFLMDDESGLGNGWDSLEVPSDFSLWT